MRFRSSIEKVDYNDFLEKNSSSEVVYYLLYVVFLCNLNISDLLLETYRLLKLPLHMCLFASSVFIQSHLLLLSFASLSCLSFIFLTSYNKSFNCGLVRAKVHNFLCITTSMIATMCRYSFFIVTICCEVLCKCSIY